MADVARTSAVQKNKRGRSSARYAALLGRHAVFAALTRDQLARLSAYAATRMMPAGTTLFSKGDPGDALYAVCAGTVKITVPSIDGREAMFNVLHAGEIFGEIALLDGQPRTADVVTLTDTELMVIERRDFLSFVHSEPKVALKLIEFLCARLRFASEHFEEVVFLNLPTRLARTLIRLEETEEGPAAEPRKLSITQQQLSLMLGVTRESINKQLSAWAKRNLIRLERGGIAVLDRTSLRAVAERQEP